MSLNLDDHFSSAREKQDFYIAIIVIAAFGSFFFLFQGGTDFNVMNSSESVVLEASNTQAVEHQMQKLIKQPEDLYRKVRSEKIVQPLPTYSFTAQQSLPMVSDSTNLENQVEQIEENQAIELDTLAEQNALVEEEIDSISDSVESSQDLPEEEDVANDELEADVSIQPNEEVPVLEKEVEREAEQGFYEFGCVVMLGVFESKINADKLFNKLEYEGYNMYRGRYRGNYTIGINTQCDKSTYEPILSKMRSTVSKDAYLHIRK